MLGTAGATAPDNPATDAWEGAFAAEYGQLPAFAYVKETYDAAIALALAAQAAGSTRGAAIRDHLRAVGSEPGTVVHAGPEGVATALRILAAGGAVDYEGAAVAGLGSQRRPGARAHRNLALHRRRADRNRRCRTVAALTGLLARGPASVWTQRGAATRAYLRDTSVNSAHHHAAEMLEGADVPFVETNVNFFVVINPFPVPRPGRDDPMWQLAVALASRAGSPARTTALRTGRTPSV